MTTNETIKIYENSGLYKFIEVCQTINPSTGETVTCYVFKQIDFGKLYVNINVTEQEAKDFIKDKIAERKKEEAENNI